jgi:iron complex transport system ATP-binding protein
MSAVLNGQDLTVVRGGRRILNQAAVTIVPGEVTTILGPNGSGKSTLLRALAGLLRPASGVVTLDGCNLSRMSRRQIARRVSFLPQDSHCDFAFTVEEMVGFGRHPHRDRFTPADDRDRAAIDAAIATCDLDQLRPRSIDSLSGGERQRVAIARCLAAEPDVLLLDEAAAHLDLEHALSVLTLCRSLADEGKAVALTTHDLGTVARHASRVVLLRLGQIVATGKPCDVLTPGVCRAVFAVDTEVVTTADGQPAFVFSMPARAPESVPAQGVRR